MCSSDLGQSFMLIGQQKGINTKMRQLRNFGMVSPEGYRKALRLMKIMHTPTIQVMVLSSHLQLKRSQMVLYGVHTVNKKELVQRMVGVTPVMRVHIMEVIT